MTTSEQLNLFGESMTSLSAASPVNRSAWPGKEKARTTIATSSPNSSESFAQFDQSGRLLKTYRGYLQSTMDGSFEIFSGSFPKQGTALNGTLFHVPKWAVSTNAIDFGLLPTPTASDTTNRKPGNPHLTKNGTIRHLNQQGQQSFMRLSQVVQLPSIVPASGLLPTPTASDATTGQIIGKEDTFRTTATGALRKVNRHGTDGSIGLGRLVQMLPTPTANDAKNLTLPQSQANRDSIVGALLATSTRVDVQNKKKKLNPDFVGAMMGFPPGWLDLT